MEVYFSSVFLQCNPDQEAGTNHQPSLFQALNCTLEIHQGKSEFWLYRKYMNDGIYSQMGRM